MNIISRRLLLVLTALLLVGCAASVTKSAPDPNRASPSLEASKQIYLSIVGPNGGDSGEDWEASKEEWQTSMSAAAAETGAVFKLAAAADIPLTQPAILLKMQVNEYRYVSQVKRYAVGVFTGNANLDIDVEFIELPLSRSLGTRKYAASSSFIHGALPQ